MIICQFRRIEAYEKGKRMDALEVVSARVAEAKRQSLIHDAECNGADLADESIVILQWNMVKRLCSQLLLELAARNYPGGILGTTVIHKEKRTWFRKTKRTAVPTRIVLFETNCYWATGAGKLWVGHDTKLYRTLFDSVNEYEGSMVRVNDERTTNVDLLIDNLRARLGDVVKMPLPTTD